MNDVQEVLRELAEKVEGDEKLKKRLADAVQARDINAVAAIAADLGIELNVAEPDLEGRELDDAELDAVVGGHESTCDWWLGKVNCAIAAGVSYWA